VAHSKHGQFPQRRRQLLELDDGLLTPLSAGDILIQDGTRHAWRNRSDRPVTMAFVLIGR
jgi:hypothetical protein